MSVFQLASIQTTRQALPALTANSNTVITVTWPTAFADTNYTVSAVLENTGIVPADLTSLVRQIRNRQPGSVDVVVGTSNNAFPAGALEVHATAFHD